MKKLVLMLFCVASINADKASQNLARFLWANYCERGGKLQDAGYEYSQITPDNDSIYVYLGYIPYLAASGSPAEIVKLIPQLDKPFKNNQEMQLLFATALEQTGKKNEAHCTINYAQ